MAAPTLSTKTTSNIGLNTCVGQGEILTGTGVTKRGFEINTTANTDPINGIKYELGSFSTGEYGLLIRGLLPNTQYYIRAFATNADGTGYGNWASFTTDTATYNVTIGGVDRTGDVLNRTLQIQDVLNDQQNSCTFNLDDRSGTGIPAVEDEITITLDNGTKLFGGYVTSVNRMSRLTGGTVQVNVQCVDYARLLDRRLVRKTYENQTDKQIIEDIVSTYAPGSGITTNNVVEGVTITQITFNYLQPTQCIRQICELTGRYWYIDYNKDIHYFALTQDHAPFDIDDSTGEDKMDSLTDNFNDDSFDTSKWTRTNATQIEEQNQRIEMTTALAGNYVAMDSKTQYDLTGSQAYIRLVDGGDVTESTVSSYEGYPLVLAKDANNSLTWLIGYSTIYAIKKVGGSTTNLQTDTWDADTYKWLRIREASGVVYWDYSTDGITWLNFTSATVASLFDISAMTAEISVGTWQAEANQVTMVVDSFNVDANGDPATATRSNNYFNLSISTDGSQIKNRVYVRGGTYLSDTTTYSEVGDGEKTKFVLPDKPHDISVTVNAVSKSVGIKNIDTEGYDWYLNFQEKYLEQDSGGAVLTASDTLEVSYKYDIPILVVVEDPSSITDHGVHEFAIFDKAIATKQAARDRASAELTDYAESLIEGYFETYETGLYSGQYIHIDLDDYGINADYIIKQVTAVAEGGGQYRYQVQIASAQTMGIIKFLIELLEANKNLIELDDDEVLDELLNLSDALLSDSLVDSLTIDSAGAYRTWASSPSDTSETRARWDLFQWAG